MRLEGALFASREGITAHGSAISVISDNISNSNTVGFKRSRTEFSDIMAEGYEGRQSQTEVGGSGVMVNEVRAVQESGMIEATGRALDAGIDGNGFFMVGDADNTYYTRAGNFQMRADGVLVNSDGQAVLGFSGTGTTLGEINLLDVPTAAQATSMMTMYGNVDATLGIKTAPAAPASFSDLAKAASSISVVEIYDSLGESHGVTLAWTKTAAGGWNVQAYVDGGEVSGGTAGTPQLVGNVDLQFGSDGIIAEANRANARITLNAIQFASGATGGGTGEAAPPAGSTGAVAIDLSNMTQYAAPSQNSGITKDGSSPGQIMGYEILKDGTITAQLDNGRTVTMGTLQLATFRNLDGLQRVGNSNYSATTEAGERTTGSPGSAAFGQLAGSSLERSTVDIATEFVDLVLYQRGYQANSQVLSAATQMIKDTIGLMR